MRDEVITFQVERRSRTFLQFTNVNVNQCLNSDQITNECGKSNYIQEILIEQQTQLVRFFPEDVHKIVA